MSRSGPPSLPPPSRCPARALRCDAARIVLLLAAVVPPAGPAMAGAPQVLAEAAPPAEAEVPRPERPEEMVRALYRALDGKDDSFSPVDWTDAAIARRLFVPSLAELAIAEGHRAVPDRRLPFDPFTGALQLRPERIAVRAVSASPKSAEVVARFQVAQATRTVNYRLSYGAQGWRIADIWWGSDTHRTFRGLLR